MSNSTAVAAVPMDQMERMALSIARSNLFGAKTPDQAMSIMLLAQAEGLHPATAARDYHIIEGRPSMKADAMLARFLGSGGKIEWHIYTDAKVAATFSHPQGGSITVDWDDERVKKSGLADRPNHKKFPRQMKRARVISEGIRTVYPGIAVGIYTPEEVQDFSMAPERDMGAAEVVHEGEVLPPAGAHTDVDPSPASGASGAFSYKSQLEAAETLDDLARVWATVPRYDQPALLETKDLRKAQLSKPATQPATQPDTV